MDGAVPLDLRLALGKEASDEAESEAAVRLHSVWVFLQLLLSRTRVSSEQALALNGDRNIIAGELAARLGCSSP